MTRSRRLQWSFSGGEQSPEMFSHAEDPGFQTGAARFRNMISTPRGPAVRRPGFARVTSCYNSANLGARLLPFKFSENDALVLELGEDDTSGGYMRLHGAGQPVKFTANTAGADPNDYPVQAYWGRNSVNAYTVGGDPYPISIWPTDGSLTMGAGSMNLASNEFTISAGHPYVTGDPIGTATAGTYPTTSTGSLNGSTVYYAIVTNSTTFRLAASYADAVAGSPVEVDITGYGSGTLYFARSNLLRDGDSVRFLSAVTSPLATGVTYYVRNNGSSCGFQLYTTKTAALISDANYTVNKGSADAFPGSAPTAPAASGVTRQWMHGELLVNPRYGTNYYTCGTEHNSAAFSAGNFLAQESDRIYTITAPYAIEDVFDINIEQSFDVMTMVHTNYTKRELRRWGALHWEIATLTLTASVDTPPSSSFAVTATSRGRLLLIRDAGAGDAVVSLASGDPRIALSNVNVGAPSGAIAKGDTVYIKGLSGRGIADGEYVASDINVGASNDFEIQNKDNTQLAGVTVGTASGATVEVAPLGSERTNYYRVTAVDALGRESSPTTPVSAENNLYVEGAYNTITFDGVVGASHYNVYRENKNIFGLLGQVEATQTLAFKDSSAIQPSFAVTPPISDTSLDGTQNPGAVGSFQQRRLFARTEYFPLSVWGTESGTRSSLQYHIPPSDTDRIAFTIQTSEYEVIRHIVGMDHLLIFTDQAEYRVTPINSDALTPKTIDVRRQSKVGCSPVLPVVTGRSILVAANRGGHVHEIRFDVTADGFAPSDVSMRAAHLFDNYVLQDSTHMKSPHNIAWWTSSSGSLLGLTFSPEHQIAAWHWHDTDGDIESCCVIPEGGEDRLYVVVNRSGSRSIQRMGSMYLSDIADAFYVDDGYTETSATYAAGATFPSGNEIAHLNGSAVRLFVDGVAYPTQTVSANKIIMPVATSAGKVSVGRSYSSQLQTMPFTNAMDALGQGRTKNVISVAVRVHKSGKFRIGPNLTDLTDADTYNEFDDLHTGVVDVTLLGEWTDDGQLAIVQEDPLPLTVVGATMIVSIGGE